MTGIIAPMRRLFPHPADHVTVSEAYGVQRPTTLGRPWVGLCMVSSLDGATVVEDNSRALSCDADRDVLLGLREFADMLLVGASTIRIEGYGRPQTPGQRVAVVSRTGNVNLDCELFTSGAGFLLLPENAPSVACDSVRAGIDRVDFAAALALIDTGFIQAEGGPLLNAALAEADVLDELNLTISPLICGGDGPRLTTAAAPMLHQMDLAHVLEEDGFLFTRYLRRR